MTHYPLAAWFGAVALAAHAGADSGRGAALAAGRAGVLDAAIGVMHETLWRAAVGQRPVVALACARGPGVRRAPAWQPLRDTPGAAHSSLLEDCALLAFTRSKRSRSVQR